MAYPARSTQRPPTGQQPQVQPTCEPDKTAERAAKTSFYQVTAEMMKAKRITPDRVNSLARQAKTDGWIEILAALQQETP